MPLHSGSHFSRGWVAQRMIWADVDGRRWFQAENMLPKSSEMHINVDVTDYEWSRVKLEIGGELS